MPTAWRIVGVDHAQVAFDGEGARLHGGRWNSPGTQVVYASESRALAVLEVLARLRSTRRLADYMLIAARFQSSLVEVVSKAELPGDWRESPPPASTQRLGDAWVANQASAVLQVPGVLLPAELNYLLNPAHPDFSGVRIGAPEELDLDPRLLG